MKPKTIDYAMTPMTWVALLVFLIFPAPYCRADIYKYVDRNGVAHYTNAPTSGRYQLFMKGNDILRDFYSTNKYDAYIKLASEQYGVDFPLVKAVIKAESNFNPKAVSRKGAQGLMQIMPSTAKILKVYDPFDPWENIMGGTKYLKMLMNKFDGNLRWVLAGYNAGPNRVIEYKGVPPYRETRDYVRKVMKYYDHLKKQGD